jgi:hypothetical protein
VTTPQISIIIKCVISGHENCACQELLKTWLPLGGNFWGRLRAGKLRLTKRRGGKIGSQERYPRSKGSQWKGESV